MNRRLPRLLFCSFVPTLALAAFSLSAAGARGALSDCVDATCRVSAGDARGTGCVFQHSNGCIFILTNAHVVGNHSAVRCEFWRHGHLSAPLAGQVIVRIEDNQCDLAVVVLPESAFEGLLPAVIPLADPGCYVTRGETLVSIGCAGGRWSTGWKGHALGYQGPDLCFLPPPADGRSGSALFDAQGTKIVGLVRARTIDNQVGIACSLQALYQGLRTSLSERRTQCFGGLCPAPQNRLLPLRPRQDDYQQPGRVWPTLPEPSSMATVDLSETNRRLDEIRDLLRATLPEKSVPQQPTAPLVPVPPADEKTQQRVGNAERAATEAQDAVADVKQQTAKLQKGLNGLSQVIEDLTGDVQTLPQRLQSRIDKVKSEGAETTREVAHAYVKDLLAEKLSDGSVGLSMGKILGGVLGLSGPLAAAMGLGAWLLSRRLGQKLEQNEPLLAAKLFANLTDRIDDLRSRLGSTKAE